MQRVLPSPTKAIGVLGGAASNGLLSNSVVLEAIKDLNMSICMNFPMECEKQHYRSCAPCSVCSGQVSPCEVLD